MIRLITLLPVVLAGSTLVAPLAPQEPPRPGSDVSSKPVAASATTNDGILASWLLVGNDNEIEVARIAKDRAQNAEVRQFAQMMIDDHRAMGEKLRPFAAAVGYATTTVVGKAGKIEEPTTAHEPGETKKDEPVKVDKADKDKMDKNTEVVVVASDRPAAGVIDAPADHVALLRELGAECLSSTRRMLESKSGADFDKLFMGMTVGAHQQALDHIVVFKRHASSSLASVLDEGERKVAMHLEHAKGICEKLHGGDLKAEPDERR